MWSRTRDSEGTADVQSLDTKKIVKYVTLPGIIPRAKDLFSTGFGYTAFLMAHIYNMVRLLPYNHPYLNPKNIGQYGFHHVIAEAANNLVLNKKNIDQIIVFFSLLAGLVIMILQFLILAYGLIISPALAQAVGGGLTSSNNQPALTFIGEFITPDPTDDIALNMLDRVFGIPDFFCSTTPEGKKCTHFQNDNTLPLNFHNALHNMFQFYSYGLLFIGILIFLYFVVVIVGETAITGTPFGERFQNVWVPIRLVVAIGLLLPLNYGINTGQYIALQAAKMGSGFATNGWKKYNDAMKESLSSDHQGKNIITINGKEIDVAKYHFMPGSELTLALPPAPDIGPFVYNMSLIHACAYAKWHVGRYSATEDHNKDGNKDALDFAGVGSATTYLKNPYKASERAFGVRPYLIKSSRYNIDNNEAQYVDLYDTPPAGLGSSPEPGYSYTQALDFLENDDLIITFGIRDETRFKDKPGAIDPTCGRIRIAITDLSKKGCGYDGINPGTGLPVTSSPTCEDDGVGGADHMQHYYYMLVKSLWPNKDGNFIGLNANIPPLIVPFTQRAIAVLIGDKLDANENANEIAELKSMECSIGCFYISATKNVTGMELPSCVDIINEKPPCQRLTPSITARQDIINLQTGDLKAEVQTAWFNRYQHLQDYEVDNKLLAYGWGGAGIWYNNIQEINGTFIGAVTNAPSMADLPYVMSCVARKRQDFLDKKSKELGTSANTSPMDQYDPEVSVRDSDDVLYEAMVSEGCFPFDGSSDKMAKAMSKFYQYWNREGTINLLEAKQSGSMFKDFITNQIFGLGGLGSMRAENASLHPLAQLTALGKGLVDSAVFNIVGGFAGGIIFADGTMGSAISSAMSSIAFIGLTAGVILFYILPLMPFIYFFFAVGSWVKTIFEAMVGVPLWALAHLRIDGEGLPGSSASNGYFLIFDIFVRPIITVFGLIAATMIFSAQVRMLNFLWELVVNNIAGFSKGDSYLVLADNEALSISVQGDGIDQFFFTIIYAIIVYMLATASFKLIDQIPKDILRWMGAGVSAFGDINDDPTQGLTRYAATSGMIYGRQMADAAGDLGKGIGNIARGEMSKGTAQSGGNLGNMTKP